MHIKTINIKENYPAVSVAVANLEIEIFRCKKEDIKILKVIHGYGSHGSGGEIKKAAHLKLREMLNNNQIKNFIPGEQWGISKMISGLCVDYPELILDADLKNFNSGITVVIFD